MNEPLDFHLQKSFQVNDVSQTDTQLTIAVLAKLNILFSSTYCRLHEQEMQSWVSQNDNNPSLFHK